jgi:hypothetical protein
LELDIQDFMKEHSYITLVDIIGFSKLSDDVQKEVIQDISNIALKRFEDGGYKKSLMIEALIPTGDGFYMVGNAYNSLFFPAIIIYLALSLKNEITDYIESNDHICEGVQLAIHFGTIVTFEDILRNKNYCGNGMNDASRLLSPLNKTDVEAIASDFFNDGNRVIISNDTWVKSDSSNNKKIRRTEPFLIKVKHNKEIECRFIDMDGIYNVI